MRRFLIQEQMTNEIFLNTKDMFFNSEFKKLKA